MRTTVEGTFTCELTGAEIYAELTVNIGPAVAGSRDDPGWRGDVTPLCLMIEGTRARIEAHPELVASLIEKC